MNLTILLTPAEGAKLLEKASAMGTTPEHIVRRAIEPILTSGSEHAPFSERPQRSLLGLWAQYGPGPSEKDIDQNRADMFSTFGRDDIA